MKRVFRSLILRVIFAPGYRSFRRFMAEFWRRITLRNHVIQVFLQVDDPYSYLLSYYLQFVARDYEVDIRVYLSQALPDEFMPQPALLAEYAARDCHLLAKELGIAFLDIGDTPVVEHRRALLDFLAGEQEQADFQETLHQALSLYWRGNTEGVSRLIAHRQPGSGEADTLVSNNQSLLRKLGHYSSATVFYAGEWYWGIDRLAYLLTRLDGLGANKEPTAELASMMQTMQLSLPAAVPASAKNLPSLEMYCSFRSPYSYLALHRTYEIADAFGLQLDLRPVLPMVMRGLPVPREKLMYIVKDAVREAARLDVPFGQISDPLGIGAERCMAVFYYAKAEGKEREYMLSAGRAIWSDGVDVATDEGMRIVTECAGLFWPDVVKAMRSDDWRAAVQGNRESLTEAGLWGVPSFVIGDMALWGQDRDWLLARQIEDMCLGEDGILI